ncbi:MAG: enoyl-CoA hydratase/isomerase family protein [Chloroflexota bacterium]
MTVSPPILYEESENIGILTVNRLEARNALNWEAQTQFAQQVRELRGRSRPLSALIIAGAGEKAFVAGGDLNELAAIPEPETGVKLRETMLQALNELEALPTVVIGAVSGHAAGGGIELLAACDLRLASTDAKFHFAQVKMGLTSGWGGVERLVKIIGQSQTLYLMLGGRSISAAEAYHVGLVHELVDLSRHKENTHIKEIALEWARSLSALPNDAQRSLKALIHFAGQGHPQAEVQALEASHFLNLFGRGNNKEALSAFTERRPPKFNQKGKAKG